MVGNWQIGLVVGVWVLVFGAHSTAERQRQSAGGQSVAHQTEALCLMLTKLESERNLRGIFSHARPTGSPLEW